MSNPVLVEVLRGSLVESRHAGAVAVFDSNCKAVLALGDIDRPVLARGGGAAGPGGGGRHRGGGG
jgi:L-asparaginase II